MSISKRIETSLSLKDLINNVKDELVASEKERISKNEEALFEVEQLVLEVNFVVTQNAEAAGGVEFKVMPWMPTIKAEAKGNAAQQQVHKITLTLKTSQPGNIGTNKQNELPINNTLGRYPSTPGYRPAR